jgi:hypothetical protein
MKLTMPFHILHHNEQRQAPGDDFHGAALAGIEIRKELIVIERAEPHAHVDIEVAFGKGGSHGSRGRVWNGWEGVWGVSSWRTSWHDNESRAGYKDRP